MKTRYKRERLLLRGCSILLGIRIIIRVWRRPSPRVPPHKGPLVLPWVGYSHPFTQNKSILGQKFGNSHVLLAR